MKILNCVIITLSIWAIDYLINSYVRADFNIRNWDIRGMSIFLTLVINALACAIYLTPEVEND